MSNIFINSVINTFSTNSVGDKLYGITGQRIDQAVSTRYPQNNMAIYVPFFVEAPINISQFSWFLGATVSNNVDMGIYSSAGTRIKSVGGIAASGTASTLQNFNVGTVELGVGLYYMGFVSSSTSSTYFAVTGANPSMIGAIGIFQQSGSYPLPATATFSTATVNYIPLMLVSGRSLV